jgi:deoxyribonuclease V
MEQRINLPRESSLAFRIFWRLDISSFPRFAISSIRGVVKTQRLHAWDVTPGEARAIQLRLRERVELEDRLPRLRRVAGADVAFDMARQRAIAGVIVYEVLPQNAPEGSKNRRAGARFELKEVERANAEARLTFPYVPGLLSFRELPALLAAFQKLRCAPDLIFCDAQGYAHPRRFGLACHLGVLLDCPTIGCAKSRLIGEFREPALAGGSRARLIDEGETIGAVVRTRTNVNPIYVSQGHRVSLLRAIELTLAVCDGFRIPRPTRDADQFVARCKKS